MKSVLNFWKTASKSSALISEKNFRCACSPVLNKTTKLVSHFLKENPYIPDLVLQCARGSGSTILRYESRVSLSLGKEVSKWNRLLGPENTKRCNRVLLRNVLHLSKKFDDVIHLAAQDYMGSYVSKSCLFGILYSPTRGLICEANAVRICFLKQACTLFQCILTYFSSKKHQKVFLWCLPNSLDLLLSPVLSGWVLGGGALNPASLSRSVRLSSPASRL